MSDHVRRHAGNPLLSLDGAARQLHMSPRLLQKLLQEMQTSFTALVNQQRLEAAMRMLADPAGDSITQVAYRAGFNDVSHFNHLFKRCRSMTPSEYRQSSLPDPVAPHAVKMLQS